MKKNIRDTFVIGFALFAMFFGAGNVIFPPYLGLESGPSWLLGFACYYIADIGLALLALFALLRRNGPEGVTGLIGKIPSALLMSAIILCIGPCVAIPRTAATTFEMSIMPFTSGISSVVFSIFFFALILTLCIRQSAVVDIVGKILTPALLIGLLILIIRGVISPMGPTVVTTAVEEIPAIGIKAGYQTLDVLAAMAFGIIILKSVSDKGYTNGKEKMRVAAGAGLIAGGILLIVYMGLTYLGASAGTFYDLSIDRAALVMSIVRNLLGAPGSILFAVVVALACVTTAVALVSSTASHFSALSNGRLSYQLLVVVTCVVSAVLSNFGLNQIIAIAAPILDIVYPPTLALIILSFFPVKNQNIYRFAVVGALGTSLLVTISTTFGVSMPFLNWLPLASLGFHWVLPTAVFAVVGHFAGRNSQKKASLVEELTEEIEPEIEPEIEIDPVF